MPATSPQRARTRVALLSRHHPGSSELIEARRELAEAKIAAAIERIVADAPPLTAEQRNRLAGLLISAGATQLVELVEGGAG